MGSIISDLLVVLTFPDCSLFQNQIRSKLKFMPGGFVCQNFGRKQNVLKFVNICKHAKNTAGRFSYELDQMLSKNY